MFSLQVWQYENWYFIPIFDSPDVELITKKTIRGNAAFNKPVWSNGSPSGTWPSGFLRNPEADPSRSARFNERNENKPVSCWETGFLWLRPLLFFAGPSFEKPPAGCFVLNFSAEVKQVAGTKKAPVIDSSLSELILSTIRVTRGLNVSETKSGGIG